MKKFAVISAASLFFLFGMLIGTSFGDEVTLFGPNQYVRVGGDPDVYTNSFTGIPGTGKLIVKNGNQIGDKRIEDAISGAVVKVNGEVIFGPSDFNQNIYYLEADIDLLESNTLYVELMSKPGSYITLEVTEDVTRRPSLSAPILIAFIREGLQPFPGRRQRPNPVPSNQMSVM